MSIVKSEFGKTKKGKQVYKYTLENQNGMRVSFIDLGAAITNIWVPDNKGVFEDIVLGYDNVSKYEKNIPSFGAPIGRVANRISGGSFSLNGTVYPLEQNDGTNCLHGGTLRYNYLMYEAEYSVEDGEDEICFSRVSPDGEQGFPGELSYSITYHLTASNELIITYQAVCDQDTIISLTNHSYFNLGVGGHKCGNVLQHEVKIFADRYTPINELHLPTGQILPTKGTIMDFHDFKVLNQDLVVDKGLAENFLGYDHNFVLDHPDGEVAEAAQMRCSDTHRLMRVFTDLPGIQLYTAPELDHETGKEGTSYGNSAAACFETQSYPNGINTPEFVSPILRAGEEYKHVTVFQFGTY